MSWDNRIININGRGLRMLERAVELACDYGQGISVLGKPVDYQSDKIIASMIDPQFGLIWLSSKMDASAIYPAPLTPRQVAEISLQWLESDEAKAMKCEDWDADCDHDGHNSCGWRLYVNDWGRVGNGSYATVCAIRPAFLWHGK